MNFVLFVLFIVLFFLVFFLYARLKDEIKNIKGKGIVEEVKKEIEGLIVEFNKVSNRKIIVMDEKIKELENLIKLADEKIIKLDTLTRNYTEMVKRYEIAKKEFQSSMLQYGNFKKNDQPKVIENKVNTHATYEIVKSKKASNDKLESQKGVLFENSELKQSVGDVSVESLELEKILNNRELIERELKRINLEELDLDVRANLLRKLLDMDFDEDSLVEIGFSTSEIEIAKIVMNKK